MDINEELENINEDELLEVLENIEIPAEDNGNSNENDTINDITKDNENNQTQIEEDINSMFDTNDNISNEVINEPSNITDQNKTVDINNPNCDKIFDVLKELLSKKRIDITIRIRS